MYYKRRQAVMNGGDVINFNMSAMLLVIVHFYKENYNCVLQYYVFGGLRELAPAARDHVTLVQI